MEELFGLPTIDLMWGVAATVGVVVAIIALIYWRQPILVRLGVRNLPRRRAQTVLVTCGLTLATIIVTIAFSTGDSLSTSIDTLALEGLRRVDHTVSVVESAQGIGDESSAVPQAVIDDLRQEFADDERIEAVFGVSIETVSSEHDAAGQVEPGFFLVGVEPSITDPLQAIVDADGDPIELGALAANEIVINELAARELAAQPGDRITLYAGGQPRQYQVAAIGQNALLTGDVQNNSGGVVGITAFHDLLAGFQTPGQWSFAIVSAVGGVEGAVASSESIDQRLQAFFSAQTRNDPARYSFDNAPLYKSEPSKADALEFAELFANIFTTLFLFMGSFSVVAGILLIFLIFAMLAEERKPEMGIARAVGMQRSHLIQSFIAEGVLYNIAAAALGVVIGLLFAVGMIAVLNSLVSSFGFSMTWSVTVTSLVISGGIGLVVTFVTVVVSSFRASRLNIVAAIRDIPESRYEEQRPFGVRVILRTIAGVIATIIGVPLTILTPATLTLGAIPFFACQVIDTRRSRQLAPWWILPGWRLLTWNSQWWIIFIIGGFDLISRGGDSESLILYMLGISLLPLGAAMGLAKTRLPNRLIYTTVAALLLVLWFIPTSWHEDFWSVYLNGGPELFVLSGVMLTTAGTLLVVFNLDLIVNAVRWLVGGIGQMAPIIRTAAAYPAAAQYRTGMTIAMIALITFALVNFTTINASFDRAFTNDEALGGFEVIVIETETNEIGELVAELEAAGAPEVVDDIQTAGSIEVGPLRGTPIATKWTEEWDTLREEPILGPDGEPIQVVTDLSGLSAEDRRYGVLGGVDQGFVDGQKLGLLARSRLYESDEAVWAAVRRGEPVTIATADAIGIQFAFGGSDVPWHTPASVSEDSTVLPRIVVEMGLGDRATEIELIGIFNITAGPVRIAPEDAALPSLILPTAQAARVIGEPTYTRHYVAVGGAEALEVAQGIERALRIEAIDLQGELDDQQELQSGFLNLFQAFIGIGLVAGLAALGVIAVRAVVERRQQIGVLRAIGFQSRMVGLELMLEMGFIALLGLGLGTALALGLAWRLFAEGTFGDDVTMFVPVGTVVPILIGAFAAALVLTFFPARQAATTTIAESLRYE